MRCLLFLESGLTGVKEETMFCGKEVAMRNVPDDWDSYYSNCAACGKQVHASEGDCECYLSNPEYSERPWLEDSGYDYCEGEWSKIVSERKHVARKDHKDGLITTGQKYQITRTRMVDDKTGKSSHHNIKRVVK